MGHDLRIISQHKLNTSSLEKLAGALQPVFTIALAIVFLGERLASLEIIGIGLAIIGSLFLSVEKKSRMYNVHQLKNSCYE